MASIFSLELQESLHDKRLFFQGISQKKEEKTLKLELNIGLALPVKFFLSPLHGLSTMYCFSNGPF